jgi:hypothetical protein
MHLVSNLRRGSALYSSLLPYLLHRLSPQINSKSKHKVFIFVYSKQELLVSQRSDTLCISDGLRCCPCLTPEHWPEASTTSICGPSFVLLTIPRRETATQIMTKQTVWKSKNESCTDVRIFVHFVEKCTIYCFILTKYAQMKPVFSSERIN